MGLPCLAGKCSALDAQRRLAGEVPEWERASLEMIASACGGETPDPFDRDLIWKGCPGQEAYRHPDVADALMVRGLGTMSPIANWPRGIAARVTDTMIAIEQWRGDFERQRRAT